MPDEARKVARFRQAKTNLAELDRHKELSAEDTNGEEPLVLPYVLLQGFR